VVEATTGSDGDATASATLEVAVSHHVVVLTAMVDSVPPQARGAVEQALTSSTKALNDLDDAGKPSSDQHPATPNVVHSAEGPDEVVDADDILAHDPWATNPGSANPVHPGAPAAKPATETHKRATVVHVPPQPTAHPTPNPAPAKDSKPGQQR
jgi:hypothetical protein